MTSGIRSTKSTSKSNKKLERRHLFHKGIGCVANQFHQIRIYMQGLSSNLMSCMLVAQPQQKRSQNSTPPLRPQLQENIKMHMPSHSF
jgi:hypothetical protein